MTAAISLSNGTIVTAYERSGYNEVKVNLYDYVRLQRK